MLISLKAGGVGLNLTAADVVIHYDPWWNPAVENQATDRAHRIGQDKAVFVYKLISENTVEDKIIALQQKKQALADNLYGGKGKAQQGPLLSAEDLEDLLKPIE
jgi:SNF2 family DNA or RNA helicase